MIPDHIKKDIDRLSEKFSISEIIDGNPIVIIIEKFPLPQGFKIKETHLLLKIPIAYPNSSLDMFWVEEDAVPKDKKLPFAVSREDIAGRKWFRYSWHPASWTPGF